MTSSRRSRASCSSELMLLHGFIVGLMWDSRGRMVKKCGCPQLMDAFLSRAIVESEGDMVAAARLLGLRADAFRQRHSTFLRRIMKSLPGFVIPRGRMSREVSYDEDGRYAASLGVD